MKEKYLSYAKHTLLNENYTCVLYNGHVTVTSTKRGVEPLLEWVDEGRNFDGFVAADKVVGKATAFLYVLLNVKYVYSKVISENAVKVFEQYGIHFIYDEKTDQIINRKGTGCCPMEAVTKNMENPHEALIAIRGRYNELKTGQSIGRFI